MRHRIDGRKFGRNTPHRKALFKNLANAVIREEQVTTTVEKAKEVRRVIDRLITLAKAGTVHARRLAFSRTRDKFIVTKLFSTLSERYKERNGGYTRVLKLSDRRTGDGANMAILELVDHPEIKRKRIKKEAPVEGKIAKEDAQAMEPVDTTKGIKRLFSSKKKDKGSDEAKAAKPAKAPKAKTTRTRKTAPGA